MSRIYFDGDRSVLSKTVGLYQTTCTRKDTGQKVVHHIAVMENAFYRKQVSQIYDLKGSSRNRYIKPCDDGTTATVLLDGNFVDYTQGLPLGLLCEDYNNMFEAIKNDTAFLYSINIVDYSMIIGFGGDDEATTQYSHMTLGIIDYLRQFDLIKRVESVSKSVAMIAGQLPPTIIEPGMYGKRFNEAIHRSFMPVTPVSSNRNS
jgi:1-phosphatidylinositol-3-phosphate 5-kinase